MPAEIKSQKDLDIVFDGNCIVHNLEIKAAQTLKLGCDKQYKVLVGHPSFKTTYGTEPLIKSEGSLDLKFDGGGVMELLTIKAKNNVSISWNGDLNLRKVIIEANNINIKACSSNDSICVESSTLQVSEEGDVNIDIPNEREEISNNLTDCNTYTGNIYQFSGITSFRNTNNNHYDLTLLEHGWRNNSEIAPITSGISGIAAGDSDIVCPAPIEDQIKGCVSGAIKGAISGAAGCAATNVALPVCVTNAALAGCAIGTASVALEPCIDISYNSIDRLISDINVVDAPFCFDPHAVQFSGVSISNDITCNPGNFFDLGNL